MKGKKEEERKGRGKKEEGTKNENTRGNFRPFHFFLCHCPAAIRFARFFSFGFRTGPRTFCGASERFPEPRIEIFTSLSSRATPCEPLQAIYRLRTDRIAARLLAFIHFRFQPFPPFFRCPFPTALFVTGKFSFDLSKFGISTTGFLFFFSVFLFFRGNYHAPQKK